MDLNWIGEQVAANTKQWDGALTTFYPETNIWMDNSHEYFKHLTEECNYLRAAKILSWDKYLKENSTILDVGCGGGWLSGFLSLNIKIKKIKAIDSSEYYLNKFLPDVVSFMGGNISKIETIQGLFTPILVESESIDVVVLSSAIHHADDLQGAMEEYRRVLISLHRTYKRGAGRVR